MSAVRRALRSVLVAPIAATLVLLTFAAPAIAAGSGSIDYVELEDSALGVLYSIPDLPNGTTPDLSTISVTVDGRQLDASAELASTADADRTVRRTAILAMDVSQSMQGDRFAEAKLAAEAFLSGVSRDVYVGLVAFADEVTTVQQPTLDRAESISLLDDLTLSRQTRLYDGVLQAVDAAGRDGQRSVLVLSDGKDTSDTALDDVTSNVEDAGVNVNVVALAQTSEAVAALEAIASAGQGAVLEAGDPNALSRVFSEQAEALAQQVLVTAQLPGDLTATEGTLSVSIDAGGETYSDTAFVTLTDGTRPAPTAPQPVTATGFAVSKNMMMAGLVAAGAGVLLLLLSAFGVFGGEKAQSVEDRIAAYALSGSSRGQGGSGPRMAAPAASPGLTGSAVGVAERALASNQGVAASVGARLEAAGMSLKPAEWLLMHAGIAFAAGVVGFLLSGGSGLMMVLFLLGGAVVPWMYLGFKRSRRLRAFNSQLADTLQLIAGGLSAGLSLAQSIDTVVRQGSEPMTTEFKRALIEARLGVSLEDALDSIGDRMQSKDFKWVVISVRIQREVGGNLAEVLSQVAATIRERAYLQRQVKSLSAEGKMSAWILGLLPLVVLGFLLMTNPVYFEPMFGNLLGWILLGVAAVLMAMAAFWMNRLIKMEV